MKKTSYEATIPDGFLCGSYSVPVRNCKRLSIDEDYCHKFDESLSPCDSGPAKTQKCIDFVTDKDKIALLKQELEIYKNAFKRLKKDCEYHVCYAEASPKHLNHVDLTSQLFSIEDELKQKLREMRS